jgi:hypothetical protein
VPGWFSRWWSFGLLALGFAGVGVMGFLHTDLVILRLDTRGTILSLLGLWLVFCLWILATFDLAVRLVLLRHGIGFIALPGAFHFPTRFLPWLVVAGFIAGLIVGQLAW